MTIIYIKVVDGDVIYATHFISTITNREDESIRQKLISYQIESNGIVIYPNQSILDIENILNELNIQYVVEELDYNSYVEKSQNIKYGSRTEAIEHLQNDIEPQSQIIPNIKSNTNFIGIENVGKDLKILELQNENKTLGTSLVNLELEILLLKGVI